MDNQDNKQNYDMSKSNFFTGISLNPQIQAQNPNTIQIQQPSQSQAFPPNIPQMSQIPMYNPNQNQQINFNINQQPTFPSTNQLQSQNKSSQSFLEKVNSTASGVFDFLKSKAPPFKLIPHLKPKHPKMIQIEMKALMKIPYQILTQYQM